VHALVAGGSGFIGSNLVARLLRERHRVTVLDNFCTGRRGNLADYESDPNLTIREHDVIEAIPDVGPFDRCYHLASPASPPGYQTLPIETLRVNSEGTRNLILACEKVHARFLFASTSEAYGDPLEHPQSETYRGNVSTTGPRSMYDEAKRFGEALTMAFARSYGLDARIVRIFNTYGPNSDPADGRLVPNFITQAIRGESLTVYGDGSQTRSLCYVSDLVEGLIRVMESASARDLVINLGTPEEHTILEFAEFVAHATGNSRPFAFMPVAVGDDPQRRKPDISRARSLLDWAPTVSLAEGMAATIQYFRQELGLANVTEPATAVSWCVAGPQLALDNARPD
jgi:UDP-glucuronate decarboxylase